jgi:integrase/recombinase XerD
MLPLIIPSIHIHKKEERLFIWCGNSREAEKIVRSLPKARWSQTMKQWHFEVKREIIDLLMIKAQEKFVVDLKVLKEQLIKRKVRKEKSTHFTLRNSGSQAIVFRNEVNMEAFNRFMEQLKLKCYSASTIRTYKNEFLQFLQTLGDIRATDLEPEHLRKYLVFCLNKGLSEHGIHSRLNALKFYYEQVLGREKFFFGIPRPKKPLQLPVVFSKEDVAAIINSVDHLKQRTMLILAYACGLRVSEVVSLKIGDIDSKRMILHIKAAKGKKDRIVSISENLLVVLRAYYTVYKPVEWLFEGQAPGEHYSVRSLQLVLRKAKTRAGIFKPGSVHGLRHSFATHLLDKGIDVMMIQKLLGHNDIKTTLRYLHVTNKDLLKIISPFDDLTGLLDKK